MSNIYSTPEAFGLESVGEFDIHEPDYSFDIFAVWRDAKSGKFYTASDSGCSCPSPFEDLKMSDLTEHPDGHSVRSEILAISDPYENPAHLISRIMAF